MVDAIVGDWRSAALHEISPRAATLCAHADKLTCTPADVGAADIAALRNAGCSDEEILNITQVIGLFAYFNRIADGLGIDPEPDW